MHPGKATATARSAAIFRRCGTAGGRRVGGGPAAQEPCTRRSAVCARSPPRAHAATPRGPPCADRRSAARHAADRGATVARRPAHQAAVRPAVRAAPSRPKDVECPGASGALGRRLAHPPQRDFLGRQGGGWRVAGRGDGSLIHRSRYLRAGPPDEPWNCATAGLAARRAPSRSVLAAAPRRIHRCACGPSLRPRREPAHWIGARVP